MDPLGNVLVTGFSSGAVDFGGGPVTGEALLTKLDAVGNHAFSRDFPSSDDLTRGDDLAVDAAGNAVVVGTLSGTIDLGAGPLASTAEESVFVGRFDPAGSLLWSKALDTGSVPAPRVASATFQERHADQTGSS